VVFVAGDHVHFHTPPLFLALTKERRGNLKEEGKKGEKIRSPWAFSINSRAVLEGRRGECRRRGNESVGPLSVSLCRARSRREKERGEGHEREKEATSHGRAASRIDRKNNGEGTRPGAVPSGGSSDSTSLPKSDHSPYSFSSPRSGSAKRKKEGEEEEEAADSVSGLDSSEHRTRLREGRGLAIIPFLLFLKPLR